jgi:hypothetical protein
MNCWKRSVGLGLLLGACSGEAANTAAPAREPAAQANPPAAAPVTATPEGPNPCATPGPVTLELEAGVIEKTPWDLEMTYAIEDDPRRGSSYVFLLRSGTRRWEARRNDSNWTAQLTWRGFCWRGGARPEPRASKL